MAGFIVEVAYVYPGAENLDFRAEKPSETGPDGGRGLSVPACRVGGGGQHEGQPGVPAYPALSFRPSSEVGATEENRRFSWLLCTTLPFFSVTWPSALHQTPKTTSNAKQMG
jgi:hypothetical protein